MSQRSKEKREENQYVLSEVEAGLLTSPLLVMESSHEHDSQTLPHRRCGRKRATDLGFSSKSTRLLAGDRASSFPSMALGSLHCKMSTIIPKS